MQACDTCHRRKSRCDKVKPICGFCQKANVTCSYPETIRGPSIRRDHVEAIERRLRQEEAKNQALSSELSRLRTLAANSSSSEPNPQQEQTSQSLVNGTGDVINEVSFLASTAAGERHYLGSTSGILFANLVRGSVNMAPETSRVRSGIGTPDLSPRRNPLLSDASLVKDTLPSKELARNLFNNYFAHDHLCYPFLLPISTLSLVDRVYSEPLFYKTNHFEAFVFDMILAIATVNVYKSEWQMLPSAETHQSRAMLRITEVLQSGGLQSLQAILLLCQYRTSSSMQDTSASMWHLVGIAVRIAYELGLHRESAYSSHISNGDLTVLQGQEIRRRCFWSLFAMDRIVGITLGRPLAINIEDIDVDLPLIENDHITNSEVEPEEDSRSNRTSIFVHVIKYRLLCGRVMRAFHGPKRQEHDENKMRQLRDELATTLNDWKEESGKLMVSDYNSPSRTPTNSSFRSKEWYQVLYHNAVLMLLRPSPILSDISGDAAALQKLFHSSKQAIVLYAYIHKTRKINYSWITLHSVFMAGLTYLYALSRHFRERRRPSPAGAVLESDPSPIEIVNDARACSNVLVAVSERWNALRHCHEVFDKLSDAVLEDAIKLRCSPPVAPQRSSTQSLNNDPSQSAAQPITEPSRRAFAGSDADSTYSSWPSSDTTNPPTIDFYAGTSPLAVDSQFRNCFADLQHYYDGGIGDPIMELSQDWLGSIGGIETTSAQYSIYNPLGQQY